MKNGQTTLAVFAFACVASLAAQKASAVVIYEDNFSQVGTLNGSAPDTADVGGATWIANTGITTNGTMANDPANSNAFLPFTPTSGHVYALTATMSIPGATDPNWAALGFSQTDALTPAYYVNNVVSPWVIHTGNGSDDAFKGPVTTVGVTTTPLDFTTANGFETYSIVLNTLNAAHWTVSFYNGATLEYGPLDYNGTNPTINYVGFGDTASAALFESFSLTVATPEPSSVVLLALAGLGLLAAARWRRRAC